MAVATVDYVRAPEEQEDQGGGVKRWLVDALPGTTVRVLSFPSPSIRRGSAPAATASTLATGSDLVVVNASGSLGADDPARSAPVEVVRALRAAHPEVPIVALLIRRRLLRTETEAVPTAPAPGPTAAPRATGTATETQVALAVDAAPACLLQAGATDYVIVDDATSVAAQNLVRHRLQQLLPARPTTLAEDPFRTPWAALYDRATGRLDATRIADALGVKLKPLVEALGLNYTAVHRAPDAPAYQAALRPVARMLEMVRDSLPEDRLRRAWLNRPRADLENASPLDVVLAGEVGAVVSLLEGAQLGVGS